MVMVTVVVMVVGGWEERDLREEKDGERQISWHCAILVYAILPTADEATPYDVDLEFTRISTIPASYSPTHPRVLSHTHTHTHTHMHTSFIPCS